MCSLPCTEFKIYKFFVKLESMFIRHKIYGSLNDPLSADELLIYFFTFLFCFLMGAIFLDSGVLPERLVLEISQKENDFDVYSRIGCVTCEPLALKLNEYFSDFNYDKWRE